ncbi:MAG TPA: AraC family transcriptional regulator [Negativicutes bacterium]
MDWLERMNRALNYIEENLAAEIDFKTAAAVACCSVYHFQRMFSFITDIPLSDYIRRRRLTLAAFDLRNNDVKVIDLALKYGYDSPVSFTRAFQKLHGVTPTSARKTGVRLKAYPRLSFHISLRGDKEMNYKIVEKAEFPVIGKTLRVSTVNEAQLKRIPRFWDEVKQDSTASKLVDIAKQGEAGQTGKKILGICTDSNDNNEFSYVIGVENTAKAEYPEFDAFSIPAATWGVFEVIGPMPGAIQELFKRIYTEFFPTSGYERAAGPDLELYYEGDCNSPDYRSEIWIPVVYAKDQQPVSR